MLPSTGVGEEWTSSCVIFSHTQETYVQGYGGREWQGRL